MLWEVSNVLFQTKSRKLTAFHISHVFVFCCVCMGVRVEEVFFVYRSNTGNERTTFGLGTHRFASYMLSTSYLQSFQLLHNQTFLPYLTHPHCLLPSAHILNIDLPRLMFCILFTPIIAPVPFGVYFVETHTVAFICAFIAI